MLFVFLGPGQVGLRPDDVSLTPPEALLWGQSLWAEADQEPSFPVPALPSPGPPSHSHTSPAPQTPEVVGIAGS